MAERQIRLEIFRRKDEPPLHIGELVEIKENVSGIVLARFTPSSDKTRVGYLVEHKRSAVALA